MSPDWKTLNLRRTAHSLQERLACLPRDVFERAVLAALKHEEMRHRARQRAEDSRHRRLFGWTWQ